MRIGRFIGQIEVEPDFRVLPDDHPSQPAAPGRFEEPVPDAVPAGSSRS